MDGTEMYGTCNGAPVYTQRRVRRAGGRRALLGLALLATALLGASCENVFGKLNNPVDPDAGKYQGYDTVSSTDDILAHTDDGVSMFFPDLVVSEVLEADGYRLQIATDAAFGSGSIVYENDQLSSNTISVMTELFAGTDYVWRASASAGGTWGAWTEARAFTLNPIPGILPEDATTVDDLTPELAWGAIEGANGYELQIADTEEGLAMANTVELSSTSYTPSALANDRTHYWRLRGLRSTGQPSGWSGPLSLTVLWGALTGIAPGDGATHFDPTPLLRWDGVEDANSYELQVAELEGDVSSATPAEITATSYEYPTNLADNDSIYWRVRAVNAAEITGPWSETAQLTFKPPFVSTSKAEQSVAPDFFGAQGVYATDIDGDGDTDVVAASFPGNQIIWWENDGSGAFTAHVVTENFSGASNVHAADMDGDGDLDLLGTALSGNEVAWWENDGEQAFTKRTITASFGGAQSVFAVDLDSDGDTDVVAAAYSDDDISWFENDGSESFTERVVDANFDGPRSVHAADVNGDGFMDIIGAADDGGDVSWWENDGSEVFTERLLDSFYPGAWSVYAADLDGDSDIDILAASEDNDLVSWWRNDGGGSFTERTISSSFDGSGSVYATDMDNDGDVDVVGAAYASNTIGYWRNNGSESFSYFSINTSFEDAWSVFAADMNGNGAKDVLATGYGDGLSWWDIWTE
jgi:hypothetical protein